MRLATLGAPHDEVMPTMETNVVAVKLTMSYGLKFFNVVGILVHTPGAGFEPAAPAKEGTRLAIWLGLPDPIPAHGRGGIRTHILRLRRAASHPD